MVPRRDARGGEQRRPVWPVDEADVIVLARRQVQCDVAAVVDEGAGEERGRRHHGRQQLFRHAAGHRRHGRDEGVAAQRLRRPPHPTRHGALRFLADGLPEQRQLGAELVQHRGETGVNGGMGAGHLRRIALGPDDQVDGAIIQVQPAAIGQHACLHARQGERALRAASTRSGVAGICVMRAPVVGSGRAPAWMERVEKPGSLSLMFPP